MLENWDRPDVLILVQSQWIAGSGKENDILKNPEGTP